MAEPYTIIFDREALSRRITELGQAIRSAYPDEPIVLVAMLKGSLYFLADLSRAIGGDVRYDMVAVSNDGLRMTLTRDITVDINDTTVIVTEEIVRTGLTTTFLLQHLEKKAPRRLVVAALLDSPDERLIDLPVAHVGFVIDSTRVVGYGLDFRERDRTLPFIARLDKARYTT